MPAACTIGSFTLKSPKNLVGDGSITKSRFWFRKGANSSPLPKYQFFLLPSTPECPGTHIRVFGSGRPGNSDTLGPEEMWQTEQPGLEVPPDCLDLLTLYED